MSERYPTGLKRGSDSLQQLKILLIDDQPIVAEAVRQLLTDAPEITLHYCDQPTQAIALATEIRPTVILLDMIMPDVDGLMLLKFLRAAPETHQVPIIMLSTHEKATAKAQSFANGANDYLIKLPDPIELIARLRYHSRAYLNLLKRDVAEKALALYNKELEERVQQRTAELQQTLEHLQQTQGQLIHDEKMTSLGLLVAGVAHEINNPINFISGNLNPLKEYVTDLLELIQLYQDSDMALSPELQSKQDEIDLTFIREDLPKTLSSLRLGVDRISNLVLSLRNFSRQDEADLKIVDLHEGLDSTLLILKPKLKDVEIIKDYGELPPVQCYAGQINQVFMNVIANAADALVPTKSTSPQIVIRTAVVDSAHVMIQITDTGDGIPQPIQSQIFDPFFTTKPVGEGTGLGLSISHSIVVDQHHGKLICESEMGQGTTFKIMLPTAIKAS